MHGGVPKYAISADNACPARDARPALFEQRQGAGHGRWQPRARRLRLVPVPMDNQGMQPDALEEALSRSKAQVVVVQPLFQNPTGATMTAARQAQIMELAERHRAFVVEDDFARYMAHSDSPPLPPAMITRDTHGIMIHVRSLTRSPHPTCEWPPSLPVDQ